jgi:hypothetical protein
MSFARQNAVCHIPRMSTAHEIREEAAKLPGGERAELAAFRLDSIEVERHWVGDEEAQRRSREMSNGVVHGLSWEQVKTDCGRA